VSELKWWQLRETDRFRPGTLQLPEGCVSFQYPNHTAYAVFDEHTHEHLYDVPYGLVRPDGTIEIPCFRVAHQLTWDEVQP
jgi:hypothetical protein